MTLVVAVASAESIWLLTDRRISFEGKKPRDDACKCMCLETTDGKALLGYAGLGMTAAGTEPSKWMSATLRGLNMPLEQSLKILGDAAGKRIPQHLLQLPRHLGSAHNIFIPAFVGASWGLYSIDIVREGSKYFGRVVRNERVDIPGKPSPSVGIAGSGGHFVFRRKDIIRHIIRLVRRCDRGDISPYAVADFLADLNTRAAEAVPSVGRRSIVVWRFRDGVNRGGGAHQFYDGRKREDRTDSIPSLSGQFDVQGIIDSLPLAPIALVAKMGPHVPKVPLIDMVEARRRFAELPKVPDDTLK